MLGFVTGLNAEANLLKQTGARVAIGGGTAAGAEHVARALVADGVTALVSFGLAGGLDPALRPGAIVVPKIVVAHDRPYPCDAALLERLGGATIDLLLGAAEVAPSQAAKARLYYETGAAAIDLESAGVARVAASIGVPFAVLRAIADPAGRDLPPAALIALDPAGRIALLRVLRSLVRQPGEIGGLVRLARDAGAARRALQAQVKLRFSA